MRQKNRMGLSDRRRVMKAGKYSSVVTLPAKLKIGREVTLAAGRLILLDPRGEINEDTLLEFLETRIEPNLWNWIKTKQTLDTTASRPEVDGR
jgi:hypothetical protein